MYKTLKKYLKPASNTLTYVEVPADHQDPKDAAKWRNVFDKEELENILYARNQEHFAQAAIDKTPFTTDPLYSLLGFTSNTDFAESLQKGKIDLVGLDFDDNVV